MARSNAFTPQLILLVMLLSIIAQGCSASGITGVTPGSDGDIRPASLSSGRGLWGVYSWEYDEARGEIKAVPLRGLDVHFDVTDYLEPPKCSVCLAIEILGITTQMHDFWVVVTLMNPTGLTAKDVRGIILDENQQIEVMDPYAATPLWDWHSPKWHNSFIPFMQFEDEREFGPGETDSVTYRLRYKDTPDFSGIRYMVDASWPGHCKEPYEFSHIGKTGPLGLNVYDQTTITAKILDWQMNPYGIQVDITPLGHPAPVWLAYNPPDWWQVVSNTYLATPGKHMIRFTAHDQESSDVLTKYLDIYVSNDTFAPNWTGPYQGIISVVGGNKSATLSYGLATDLMSPVVKYQVYMDFKVPYDFVDAKVLNDIGPTPKTIYGLANGVTYAFIVRAMDSSGNMEWNKKALSCIPHE